METVVLPAQDHLAQERYRHQNRVMSGMIYPLGGLPRPRRKMVRASQQGLVDASLHSEIAKVSSGTKSYVTESARNGLTSAERKKAYERRVEGLKAPAERKVLEKSFEKTAEKLSDRRKGPERRMTEKKASAGANGTQVDKSSNVQKKAGVITILQRPMTKEAAAENIALFTGRPIEDVAKQIVKPPTKSKGPNAGFNSKDGQEAEALQPRRELGKVCGIEEMVSTEFSHRLAMGPDMSIGSCLAMLMAPKIESGKELMRRPTEDMTKQSLKSPTKSKGSKGGYNSKDGQEAESRGMRIGSPKRQKVAQEKVLRDTSVESRLAMSISDESEGDKELGGRPIEDVTRRSIEDVTRRPIEGVRGRLIEDVTGGPIENVSGRPIEDVRGRPIVDVSRRLIEDVTGRPIQDVTGRPIEDVARRPIEDVTGRPIEDVTMQFVKSPTKGRGSKAGLSSKDGQEGQGVQPIKGSRSGSPKREKLAKKHLSRDAFKESWLEMIINKAADKELTGRPIQELTKEFLEYPSKDDGPNEGLSSKDGQEAEGLQPSRGLRNGSLKREKVVAKKKVSRDASSKSWLTMSNGDGSEFDMDVCRILKDSSTFVGEEVRKILKERSASAVKEVCNALKQRSVSVPANWDGSQPAVSGAGSLEDMVEVFYLPSPSPPKKCERWAGPAYTNSPPPSTLPFPNFPLQRVKLGDMVWPGSQDANFEVLSSSAPPSPSHMANLLLSAVAMQQSPFVDPLSATKDLRRILNLDVAEGFDSGTEGFDSGTEWTDGGVESATQSLKRMLQLG